MFPKCLGNRGFAGTATQFVMRNWWIVKPWEFFMERCGRDCPQAAEKIIAFYLSILRHGFAVPPPLPKEANEATAHCVGSLEKELPVGLRIDKVLNHWGFRATARAIPMAFLMISAVSLKKLQLTEWAPSWGSKNLVKILFVSKNRPL